MLRESARRHRHKTHNAENDRTQKKQKKQNKNIFDALRTTIFEGCAVPAINTYSKMDE